MKSQTHDGIWGAYIKTLDNEQYLTRVVVQRTLPKDHPLYRNTMRPMLQYLSGHHSMISNSYEFMYPSFNEFHSLPEYVKENVWTDIIEGQNLPDNVIKRHQRLSIRHGKLQNIIRPRGRYIIVTHILRSNEETTKKPKRERDEIEASTLALTLAHNDVLETNKVLEGEFSDDPSTLV